MQYWKTYQKDLILEKLEEVSEKNLSITVWQQYGNHRHTFKANLTSATKQLCQIKLSSENDNLDHFDPERAIFIHVIRKEIIFKKEKFNKHGSLIEFSLPGDIQLYERRHNKRYYYLYQDHKSITYHSESREPGTMKPVFTETSVLVDISIAGAGMVVGPEIIEDLKVGDSLFLVNLTDQKLPEPFRVKIVYINPYIDNEKDLYKIGLVFDDELDSISYKSISSIVEIKQKKTEGLNPNVYCGLDFEEQVKMLNQVEAANKVLANNLKDNIEYLDQLRYMTTKMKVDFLKTVNHDLLAVALRLSSKELIFELFSEVTQTMQEEFLEKMQDEKSAAGISKAQDVIITQVRQMEASGLIVLDPTAFVTYV